MFQYRAFVNEVIDGDTIDVTIDLGFSTFKKTRLRLYGINCPESKSKNLKEKKAGIKAKLFVEHIIKNKYVCLNIIKQEKFGRYLAIVKYAKNSMLTLNDILVTSGFAKKYYGEKRMGYAGNGMIKKEGI